MRMKKILLVSLIMFLTGEIFLRLFYPQAEYSVTYAPWGWKHIPNTKITFWGEHPNWRWKLKPPIKIKYDDKGLRSYSWPYQSGVPNVQRILILGDSFAEDMGSVFENLVATRLQKLFNYDEFGQDTKKAVAVINAGHYGFCNAQEYMYYLAEGHKFSPDIVLVFYAQDTANPNYAELKEGQLILKWKKFTLSQKIYKNIASLIRLHSHLGSYVLNSLHRIPKIENFIRKKQLNENIKITSIDSRDTNNSSDWDFKPIDKILWREFNQLVKAENTTLILMNCMEDFTRKQKEFLDSENILHFAIIDSGAFKIYDKRKESYNPKKESHRFGYGGNEIVAEIIYRFLEERGLVK